MANPEQVTQGWMFGKVFRLRVDRLDAAEYLGHWVGGSPNMKPTPYKKGDLVKVVMVSRFGDCGITADLTKERGYATRVYPWDLEPTEAIPDGVCGKCNLLIEDNHPGGKCPEYRVPMT